MAPDRCSRDPRLFDTSVKGWRRPSFSSVFLRARRPACSRRGGAASPSPRGLLGALSAARRGHLGGAPWRLKRGTQSEGAAAQGAGAGVR